MHFKRPIAQSYYDRRPVICVFCGAYSGTSPLHIEAARTFATALHTAGARLVYGGSTNGVMGELAKTLVSLSGKSSVHGIIPRPLLGFERDPNSIDPTTAINEDIFGRTTLVEDMHTRKKMMAAEVLQGGPGSGFVALSGGFGTLDELMEIITWNQLGVHNMPIVVYNVDNYYGTLLDWIEEAAKAGFIKQTNTKILKVAETSEGVLKEIRNYRPVIGRANLKWGEQ